MRLVAWNCHGGLAKKTSPLLALSPDLAVLSEPTQRDAAALAGAGSGVWMGDNSKKGLAVMGFNGWVVEQAGAACGQWFLPVTASRGPTRVNIAAAWVKPTTDYVSPTLQALDRLAGFLAAENAILVGDFNQSVNFDRSRSAARRFHTVVRTLAGLGLQSAWHHARQEAHGSETASTLYQHFAETKAFHIDYAFASSALVRAISSVDLGSFADWAEPRISDHVPLTVNFDLGADG